jgi:CDP-diacylglycerol--glycerol-3-phosphate 3-phosphatidyltransferase
MTTADDRAAAFLTAITYLRIALTPVVMALVIADTDPSWARPVAFGLFGFAALTDFFDGRLARRWKQTSALGNFLDTTADKLLVSGVLIALVEVGHASIWVAFIIIGRELLIMGLRGIVASEGAPMSPSIWGKAKAWVQFIAIVVAIWWPDVRIGGMAIGSLALWIAAVVTIASAVEYLARFRGVLTQGDASRRGR